MKLDRYRIARIEPWIDGNHFALIRDCYTGRDWPRFWRGRWKVDVAIDTYATRDAAERALARIPAIVKDIAKGGD